MWPVKKEEVKQQKQLQNSSDNIATESSYKLAFTPIWICRAIYASFVFMRVVPSQSFLVVISHGCIKDLWNIIIGIYSLSLSSPNYWWLLKHQECSSSSSRETIKKPKIHEHISRLWRCNGDHLCFWTCGLSFAVYSVAGESKQIWEK